jgi:hypothetical protein
VVLRCGSCGVDYPIHQFAELMDEELEEALALIRCDRL